LDTVWQYINDNGLVDTDCFKVFTGEGEEEAPKCEDKCEDGELYKIQHFCATVGEEGIRREIETNGPVLAGLAVYTDFLGYAAGIYKPHPSANKLPGFHIVEIIGWGMDPEDKEEFWIIKNSWGEDWGEDGYARIAKGVKELGLEDLVTTGVPLFEAAEEAEPVPAEPIEDETLDEKASD
jgi:hypothetical protein